MEVVFGGDFYPGRRWEEKIINNAASIWSEEVVSFFHEADLRIVNLETPLTLSNIPIKKIDNDSSGSLPRISDGIKRVKEFQANYCKKLPSRFNEASQMRTNIPTKRRDIINW